MSLTPKQEKFAQCVAEGMTQADAYREAYDCKPTTKPESIINKASELMRNGYIAARVEELRKPIIEKVGITLETHLKDLMMLRNLAAKNGQYSAAISAEVARGKASGVHIEKTINAEVNLSSLTDEQLNDQLTARLEEAGIITNPSGDREA